MPNQQMLNGIIIHSISGFYYVEAAGFVYECKAKGAFRKDKRSPLVGDNVLLETNGDKGFIVRIEPRKNMLSRPPVANIDKLFIVSSADRPKPNLFVIDKMTALAVYHGIEPVIVFSKTDLADVSSYATLYRRAGFKVICCSAKTGEGMDFLNGEKEDHILAFTGNSGVGKSSLLNYLLPELNLETNDISVKLGRGKHTTRSVQLYRYKQFFVVDTPGFSSVELEETGERIFKDELANCFPDFSPFVERCRFYPTCSHTVDKGCAVCAAVEQGLIARERHTSYCRLYNDVKDLKHWQ